MSVQRNHSLVKETVHRIERDTNVTLSKVYREVAEARSKYGNDVLIIISTTVHVPNMLPVKAGDANEKNTTE